MDVGVLFLVDHWMLLTDVRCTGEEKESSEHSRCYEQNVGLSRAGD
jgi:hypothetical protein